MLAKTVLALATLFSFAALAESPHVAFMQTASISLGDVSLLTGSSFKPVTIDMNQFNSQFESALKDERVIKAIKQAKSKYLKAFAEEDARSHLVQRGYSSDTNLAQWTKLDFEVGNQDLWLNFNIPVSVNCGGQPTKVMKIATRNNDDVEFTVVVTTEKGIYGACR